MGPEVEQFLFLAAAENEGICESADPRANFDRAATC